jgi:hypothetical protein
MIWRKENSSITTLNQFVLRTKIKANVYEPLYMQDPNPLAPTILEEVKKEDE